MRRELLIWHLSHTSTIFIVVLQLGSWLFNLAFILFPRVGHRWDPDDMWNQMVLPIFFCWHIFLNLTVLFLIFLSQYLYLKVSFALGLKGLLERSLVQHRYEFANFYSIVKQHNVAMTPRFCEDKKKIWHRLFSNQHFAETIRSEYVKITSGQTFFFSIKGYGKYEVCYFFFVMQLLFFKLKLLFKRLKWSTCCSYSQWDEISQHRRFVKNRYKVMVLSPVLHKLLRGRKQHWDELCEYSTTMTKRFHQMPERSYGPHPLLRKQTLAGHTFRLLASSLKHRSLVQSMLVRAS